MGVSMFFVSPEPDILEVQSLPTSTRTTRPQSIQRSRYEKLAFEKVPLWKNFLSTFSTWILLAGFLVLPDAFSTLEAIETTSGNLKKVLHVIRNLPLLVIAYSYCAIGASGMCFLWWRQSHNCVWLLIHIFLPGTINGLSGLISTFVNMYARHDSVLGVPSITTLAVTGVCMAVCGVLTTFYRVFEVFPIWREYRRQV